ncbi:MAG: hypothetical protein ACOYKE_15320, partial [Ferruginibacter sp.]
MASKKYKFLLGLLTLVASSTFAQSGNSGYSVFDSSVVPSKKLPQQNEFWNNTYNFPAKPRNMWEVGASIGALTISSDVSARFPTFGFEAHVRKAMGYVFSLRLQYVNGVAKGLNWLAAENFAKNPAWSAYGAPVRINSGQVVSSLGPQGGYSRVFYNYKTNVQDLSLQGIVTLNNIRFHKAKTGFNFYGGAGIGVTLYNVNVNALDANGRPYTALFNSSNVINGTNATRKNILKELKDQMDNTYETAGENQGDRRPKMGKNTLKPSGTVLMGISYKLGKRINLALEDRHTFVKDDLLDGQRWQEHAWGDAV